MKQLLTLCLLLGSLAAPLHAQQPSATARSMAKQGLVDIHELAPDIPVSLMYARADNFTGKVLYKDLKEAYLHPKAAKALAKAQQILKKSHPELTLKVYDAARPMHIQQIMWNVVAGTPKNIYVSNPKNGGGMHNYGMAVDLTLADAKGDSILRWERSSITWDRQHTSTRRLCSCRKRSFRQKPSATANCCAR